MKWFGFKLHLVADTRYELPVDFRVEAAGVSETPVCREMMAEVCRIRRPASDALTLSPTAAWTMTSCAGNCMSAA